MSYMLIKGTDIIRWWSSYNRQLTLLCSVQRT